jgi:CheY-like chemotaxis protein
MPQAFAAFSSALHHHIKNKAKILIIDDSELSRVMLKKFCLNKGFHHLDVANDGMEALEKIIQWKPDLLFLDLNMPRMNGLELCQELQKNHYR